jgi:ABC-type transporter Mla MlaB component
MLRIDLLGTATLRMSGRMAEGCREVVETFVGSHAVLPSMVVDLSEVTYVDRAGEAVLCWLGQREAKFTADNPYVLHVCERLHLSLAEPHILAGRPHDMQQGGQHE